MSTSTPAPPSGPAEVRAWLVTSVLDFLPPDLCERFLSEVNPQLAEFFAQHELDRLGWAPFDDFVEALEVADRVAGQGDLKLCVDIGRYTARREIGPVRSLAEGVLQPVQVMSKAAAMWSMHYRNAGRPAARPTGDRGLLVSLIDVPRPHRAHCLAVLGWIHGVLELGPRSKIRVKKTACRCDGAATCDYDIAWGAD